MKYTDRNRKDRFNIRIQYLLSVRLNAAFQPNRLKFLLSFRKSLRLKMKRGRQLDFDDETEGRGVDAMGRRCLEWGGLGNFTIGKSCSALPSLPPPPPHYEK